MGRAKISVKAVSGKTPKSDIELLLSYEKFIISSLDKDLFERLYFYNSKNNKKIKDLNSSIYYCSFVEEGDYLKVDNFNIYLSCYDDEFLEKLVIGAMKNKNFSYKDMDFEVENIEFIELREVREDYAMFKTMSPIVIKNKDGRYLDIEDSEYQDILNYITNEALESIRGKGLKKHIKLVPLDMKKVVLKEKIKNFSDEKYYYINAFKGIFILRGDKEDLNDIQKIGIGFRRSQGKGCIVLT